MLLLKHESNDDRKERIEELPRSQRSAWSKIEGEESS
jgi:hypothetical protein